MPAPAMLVKGWEGRVIYYRIGLAVKMYLVLAVEGEKVYLCDYKNIVRKEACNIAKLNSRNFYQPVMYMPELEADEQYMEIDYRYWKKTKYHAAKNPYGGVSITNKYCTHYVNIKPVTTPAVRFGSRAPLQRIDRSRPKVTINFGW